MAIYRKGADTVALRASAGRLTGLGRELEGIGVECNRAVGALRGSWGGGDLDQLVQRWPGTDQELTACRGTLDSMAAALSRNAGAQHAASGGAGGGSPFSRNATRGDGNGNGGDRS